MNFVNWLMNKFIYRSENFVLDNKKIIKKIHMIDDILLISELGLDVVCYKIYNNEILYFKDDHSYSIIFRIYDIYEVEEITCNLNMLYNLFESVNYDHLKLKKLQINENFKTINYSNFQILKKLNKLQNVQINIT